MVKKRERRQYGMKKIVLLGDSIRLIGYGKKVEEVLQAEGCDVWQPEDNCRFAKYTLRMLFDFQDEIKGADIVHWNNGLWDACDIFGDGPFTSLDEYVDNMLRIADILQKWTKNVIFATTTPTHPEYPYHELERIKRYNDAVVLELQKKGIKINDLFGAMENHCIDGICADQLHLNDFGSSICAEIVLNAIHEAL